VTDEQGGGDRSARMGIGVNLTLMRNVDLYLNLDVELDLNSDGSILPIGAFSKAYRLKKEEISLILMFVKTHACNDGPSLSLGPCPRPCPCGEIG
jgi:hypothetical protein